MTARLWSADGLTGTLAGHPAGGRMLVRIDGETVPVTVEQRRWVFAPACDYCDQPATVQLRDGQPDDVLCDSCASGQFTHPGVWVRPLPRAVIRGYVNEQIHHGMRSAA